MLAINAMHLYSYDTGKNLDRQAAILSYHIANPNALLFKDEYTMDAMYKAVHAIRYTLGIVKG